MKKLSLFGITGYGLLIVGGVYWAAKYINKNSTNNKDKAIVNQKTFIDITQESEKNFNEINLDEIKRKSAGSMYDRHKEAAQVVKDSIGKINENIDLPSEHEKEFNDIFKELDNLSEER